MTKRLAHLKHPLPFAAALTACLTLATPGQGRQLARFLPDGDLAPTIRADPREPELGARLIGVFDAVTEFGGGVEGEAVLGQSVPLALLSGDSPTNAVILAVQGGVFGRFLMETRQRDLISTDWMFAIPVFVWRGDTWFRFRYRHASSHIGDEYVERFSVERSDFSRDALGFLAYHNIEPGVGLYAGGEAAILNVEPNNSDPVVVQAGIEYTEPAGAGPTQLYGGVDVTLDQDASWRPRVTTQAGVMLFPHNGHRLRFVFELAFGPSRQGEFHRLRETVVGLGLLLEM